MARVLVSYVGNNDPYGKEDPRTGERTIGPMLSILDHLQSQDKLPDRVILLVTETHEREFALLEGGTARHSQEGMENQAKQLKEAVEQRYPTPIQVDEIILQVNPADLDEVIQATLEGLRGQLSPEDEVHINVSSGTQAMSAAIVFLVDSGHIQHYQVWQSLNPTKLPLGAVRVKPVNLAYLSERDRLERAFNMLRATAFGQARIAFNEIARLSLIPERRPRAKAVAQLMEVYRLWDRAEFGEAAKQMEEAEKRLRRLGLWNKIPRLQEQKDVLEKLHNEREVGRRRYGRPRETRLILEDLYAGLLRRRRSGHFINIPTRARRLYEGILNFLIYEGGLNPRGRLNQNTMSHLKKDVQQRIRNIVQGERLTNLWERSRVASILAQEGYLDHLKVNRFVVDELTTKYDEFDEVRNRSYEEHGLEGVSQSEADRTVSAATSMMQLVFRCEERELVDHPFGTRALEDVVEALRAWL